MPGDNEIYRLISQMEAVLVRLKRLEERIEFLDQPHRFSLHGHPSTCPVCTGKLGEIS